MTVWMKQGANGTPKEFPYEPLQIAALMNQGWRQCAAPAQEESQTPTEAQEKK